MSGKSRNIPFKRKKVGILAKAKKVVSLLLLKWRNIMRRSAILNFEASFLKTSKTGHGTNSTEAKKW